MTHLLITSLGGVGLMLLLAFSYYAKILDWILILIACLAATAWAAVHNHFSVAWSIGSYLSANMFWFLVKVHRRSWHSTVFWSLMIALIMLHTAALYVLVRVAGEIRPIWTLPMYAVGFPLIAVAVDWVLRRSAKNAGRGTDDHLCGL